MKNRKTETRKSVTLTAKFEEPVLLEALVEQLADRRADIGYGDAIVPPDFHAIETSTIEAFVSGDLQFTSGIDCQMPFTTSFLFTCVKGWGGMYNLRWSNSLS
jgi:hypothetical protein